MLQFTKKDALALTVMLAPLVIGTMPSMFLGVEELLGLWRLWLAISLTLGTVSWLLFRKKFRINGKLKLESIAEVPLNIKWGIFCLWLSVAVFFLFACSLVPLLSVLLIASHRCTLLSG